ncbi:hypothetical protein IKS57_04515, partial [bacterium]|nr:hypothetical protein [bacterium]
MTAADSLSTTSNQSTLKSAIKNAIYLEILDQNDSFVINDISYTAQDISNGLSVTLPSSISLSNDENGIMPKVNLQYDTIALSNTSNTQNFTVQGFETTTAQTIGSTPIPNTNPDTKQKNPYTTRNQEIRSALNSLLNQIITVSGYNTTTASDALQNASSLQQAIINAIQQEIAGSNYDFTFNNITYSIANIISELTVSLPSASSLSADATQIDNVTIEYDEVELSNKANSNDFIIEGFESTTSSTPNPSPSKTGHNSGQTPPPTHNSKNGYDTLKDVASKLSSIIKNPIALASGYSLTAQQSLSSSS